MFCCLTCLCENEGGVHPTFRSRRSRPSLTRQAMGGVAGFSAVRIDRAPFPAFSPGTTSRASFKPPLSWVNAIAFVGIPTARSSPCWRVPGFACRKQSISVFRTSAQMVWSFAVRSSQEPSRSPSRHRPGCPGTIPPAEACLYPTGRSRIRFPGAAHATSAPRRNRRPRCGQIDRLSSRTWTPTIHSLRHTFAVRALETCPDGEDRITKHMLALSVYLGHSKVADTCWYLEATRT